MKNTLLVASLLCISSLSHAAENLPSTLTGKTWQLVQFQSMDDAIGTVLADDPTLYEMTLNADGTASFRLNCNRASGSWSAEASADGSSGSLSFGPLAATRALCPPPSLDEQIARDAMYIRSYLLRDGQLYMSLMADGGIYRWREATGNDIAADIPRDPADGGPRYWQVSADGGLNLRMGADISSQRLAAYPDGTILNNLGCVAGSERPWCDVQALGGGLRGYVAADYLAPAVAPHGAVLMGENDSALRAGMGEFDATGFIPCAQGSGEPMGSCAFGVARGGGGDATVVISRPDSVDRVIFFQLGLPMSANNSQADGYPDFTASKENDLHLLRVGEERYEIPDAVIFGG